MGNRFEITLEAKTTKELDFFLAKAVTEISRIEDLLSTYKPTSETNLINENAGIKPVKVSDEVFALIKRCKKISEITEGTFDITYGSIDKRFWNFDTKMTSLPDENLAKKSIALINYRNIELDAENKTVFLKKKGMRIGFGGIGKGYAAEKTKILMKNLGVKAGIINASGDLSCWGIPENGKPWTIGIANPDFVDMPFSTSVSYTHLDVYKRQNLGYAQKDYSRQKDLNQSKASSDKVMQQAQTEAQNQNIMMRGMAEKLRACLLYTSRCV